MPRISGDSSAARELREEDLFKASRQEKKNQIVFQVIAIKKEARPLHHFLLSSLLSQHFGDVDDDHCQSNKQVANCNGWLGLVKQPNQRRHEHIGSTRVTL
jgi:hypothetical protein